jgi:tetratricopeptide (TPR) repeat protein
MRRPFLLTALILSAISLAWAQGYMGQGRVSGVVTDAAGRPLEGVKIKLFSIKAHAGFETSTNAKGEWKAVYIRGGVWNIDFEKEAYYPKKISVELQENARNSRIEIELAKMEGFVVSDTLKDGVNEGNRLFDERKFEEAARIFEGLAAQDPNAYILFKNVGNCYFELQRYDVAEQAYLRVLEKDPGNAEIIMLIGNTYSNRGDQAKALEWYGKIDIGKIIDPTALFNIASSFFAQSNFAEALKYARRAVELQPGSTDALHLAGLINLNLGDKAAAIEAFERYLKLDPDSERAGQVRSFLEFLKK